MAKIEREKKPPKYRAKNEPGSALGSTRYELYKNAFEQVAAAFNLGFYVETISICESIIADRLEARISCIKDHDPNQHQFRTLRNSLPKLDKIEPHENVKFRKIIGEVTVWEDERNFAIHEIVKVKNDETRTSWKRRQVRLRRAARVGMRLSKSVSAEVQRLNRKTFASQSSEK